MYLPSFRHLIEIEALKTQNQSDLAAVAAEEKRISDLESLREKRRQNITALDEEIKAMKLIEKQLEVESLEAIQARTRQQLDTLASEKDIKAMQQQLEVMAAELKQKEEQYFNLLERSEEITSEKKQAEDFLQGSLKTLEEIKADVVKEKQKFLTQIANRQLRIESLEPEVAPAVLKFYKEIEKKFAGKKAVAFLIDKKCSACFIQVDSLFKTALEEGRTIESCPNCGRFLIPETSKIY